MQTSEPSLPQDPQDGDSHSSDEPEQEPVPSKSPEEIWEEIVAQLSDLSTNMADGKTSPPQSPSSEPKKLRFPTAPWVSRPWQDPRESAEPGPTEPAELTGETDWQSSDPRNWQDDQNVLMEIDRFVEPDPPLELSADPVRNVGWFLTVVAGLAMLVSAVFMRPVHAPSMLILLGLFLGGIALLIWRMPNPPDGTSQDSGAVV